MPAFERGTESDSKLTTRTKAKQKEEDSMKEGTLFLIEEGMQFYWCYRVH